MTGSLPVPQPNKAVDVIAEELSAEVSRQDALYGPFGGQMPVGRLRLGVAVLQDECDEVLEAWAADRKTGDWSHTREESLQVAAVAMRLVRQIDAETAAVSS